MELTTYSLSDLIPFTLEVYERLLIGHNEDWFPIQIAAMVLGGLLVWAAHSKRSRLVGAGLAACWVWVGWAYFATTYSSLNWAGEWIAYACFAQAAALMLGGFSGLFAQSHGQKTRVFGIGIALFGLIAYALSGFLSVGSWSASQFFGHSPEPTAIVTLGLLVSVARYRLIFSVVPLGVCALAGVTSWVLGSTLGLVTLGVALLALVGVVVSWLKPDA